MYPEISQSIWIVVAIVAFVGAWFLRPKRDKTISLEEAIKFKSLYLRIKRCLKVVEDGDYYERIKEIESLSPLLKNLDIETPPLYHGKGISLFYASIRAWKDFLEQLVPLAEADTDINNLKVARRIYRELLELP